MPVLYKNSKPISSALTGLACAALMVITATPATALSCMTMGPGDVYRIVSESEESFIVLEGSLSFDETLLPTFSEEAPEKTAKPTEIAAEFSGLMLGDRIFDQTVEGQMTLEAHCLGTWCGRIQSDRRYLIFARQTEQGVVATVEPCSSFIFDAEDGTAGDIVLQCHRGRACPSLLPERLEDATEDQQDE